MSLPNPTQLLLRHRSLLQGDRVLIVDPPDLSCAISLLQSSGAVSTTFLTRRFGTFQAIQQGLSNRATVRFASWIEPHTDSLDTIIVYLPKGKALLEMTLDLVANSLATNGKLLLVGGNREGIGSAVRYLAARFTEVRKQESARHASLYVARQVQAKGGRANPQEWLRRWPVSHNGLSLSILNLPGVFSDGRLDAGSEQLLRCLRFPQAGRVLDLGCGAGVLGLFLAKACPGCTVEMVDESALALESVHATVALNRLANVRCYPSDVFSEIEGSFTYIVSNPPFHHHVRTDYRVHRELIQGAARHLLPEGELHLVVNRFLRIQALLAEYFREVVIDADDGRYRVYRATGLPSRRDFEAARDGRPRIDLPLREGRNR